MATLNKINLAEKLASVSEHWSPKIIAELNGQHVKIAKLLGEFDWHFHEHEDELFWVISGQLQMHIRNDSEESMVEIGPGELFTVPRGQWHRPVAVSEVEVVLFEPTTTLNTGNIENDKTRHDVNWI